MEHIKRLIYNVRHSHVKHKDSNKRICWKNLQRPYTLYYVLNILTIFLH